MFDESAWGCWQAPESVQEAQTLYATLEVNMLVSTCGSQACRHFPEGPRQNRGS